MVGLPDSAVRESRERVVSAMRSCGFQGMSRRITVNLAPADVRKEGSAFDLALAIGMLLATEQLECKDYTGMLFLGELSLDGGVQAIRGVLSMAVCARERKWRLVVPKANLAEALAVKGVEAIGVETLQECVALLANTDQIKFQCGAGVSGCDSCVVAPVPSGSDFVNVQGMAVVRRSLEIAAAGWHHFLMVGSPGAGKTLCAQCVPGILAPMSSIEALESTMIHSCTGLLKSGSGLIKTRPFRAPHHTATPISLVGGGRIPKPGEVSLAHNGMLFLDEFPEFSRASLEGLRQPLEEGSITVTRAMESVVWPARFLLGAAMNPCPCGYSLDPSRECQCSPLDVQRYRQRVSGPMLDRIDLQIQVPNEGFDVFRHDRGESSAEIGQRVRLAVERQRFRFRKDSRESDIAWNSRLSTSDVRRFCTMDAVSENLLKTASLKLKLSARGVFRVLKVARTIADLQGRKAIERSDVAEAVQYRLL